MDDSSPIAFIFLSIKNILYGNKVRRVKAEKASSESYTPGTYIVVVPCLYFSNQSCVKQEKPHCWTSSKSVYLPSNILIQSCIYLTNIYSVPCLFRRQRWRRGGNSPWYSLECRETANLWVREVLCLLENERRQHAYIHFLLLPLQMTTQVGAQYTISLLAYIFGGQFRWAKIKVSAGLNYF